MTTQHFTAWLVNDLSCLDTAACDVTVLQDEQLGDDDDPKAWASHGPRVFHAVTTVDAKTGEIDDAKAEAEQLLEDAGWSIVGKWDAVPNAYTVTVERA